MAPFEDINELVENLVHKKILSRIERGKYCRSNFRDEKVIGARLVEVQHEHKIDLGLCQVF